MGAADDWCCVMLPQCVPPFLAGAEKGFFSLLPFSDARFSAGYNKNLI